MCKPGWYRRFCLVSVTPLLIIGILISAFPVNAASVVYNWNSFDVKVNVSDYTSVFETFAAGAVPLEYSCYAVFRAGSPCYSTNSYLFKIDFSEPLEGNFECTFVVPDITFSQNCTIDLEKSYFMLNFYGNGSVNAWAENKIYWYKSGDYKYVEPASTGLFARDSIFSNAVLELVSSDPVAFNLKADIVCPITYISATYSLYGTGFSGNDGTFNVRLPSHNWLTYSVSDSIDSGTSVSAISVSSDINTVYPGSTVDYIANVSGSGEFDPSVTWSILGASSPDTTISDTGVLTVSREEVASQITVIATSVQDSSISGNATLTITPFPGVDELAILPGKVTALEGVAFAQQFILGYADGTPCDIGSPVWRVTVVPPDSALPDFDNIPSWVSLSDTGLLTLTSESVADYMIVVSAKLGSEWVVGSRVFVSAEETDYLKDIINGSEEQQAAADDFKNQASNDAQKIDDAVQALDQIGMPNIDDINIGIIDMIDASGFLAVNAILGVLWNNNIIMTVMTFAFVLAMVAFFVFGKR